MAVRRIIPEVRSRDVAATERLYVDVLGLGVSMRDDSAGFLSFSSPDTPAAQVIVNDNGCAGLPPGFAVDVGEPAEVERIHAAAVARGLPVVEPLQTTAWGIRRFSFVGHAGERITVVAHVPG